VTRPRRVWLTRALIIALVRMARLRGIQLCPNYIVAEDALALDTRDLYTARELLQMVPLAGYETYLELLQANAWWGRVLPNAAPAAALPERDPSARPGSLLERLLGGRAGGMLEASIMRWKAPALARAAAGSGECVFDESTCKGHAGAYRERTREALEVRLHALGVGEC
jgi:hypothetical protein